MGSSTSKIPITGLNSSWNQSIGISGFIKNECSTVPPQLSRVTLETELTVPGHAPKNGIFSPQSVVKRALQSLPSSKLICD